MTPPFTRRRSPWVVVGLLAVAAGGCGLGDYETRMSEAQERLDHLDRENEKLDKKPLEMPEAKVLKDPKEPEDVFLRVPKGVSTTPQTGNLVSKLFFKYAGDKSIAALYVAWAADKEKKFSAKVHGADLFKNARRKDFQYTTIPAPGREPLTLNATTYEKADLTYHLYLDPTNQKVALVFEISHNAPVKTATDLMHLSLGTLAFGKKAREQRTEYKNRTKGAKK